MQEWEYLYVKIQYGGYTAWTMEGDERQSVMWSHKPGAPPVYDYFNQLRDDGWSLFEDSPAEELFMFRRLRP